MAGRHDSAERRVLKRSGRQKGGWACINAATLKRAGYGDHEGQIYYRTWAAPRGRVVIQLYREK